MTNNPDEKIIRETRDPTQTAVSYATDLLHFALEAVTVATYWAAPDNMELFHALRRIEDVRIQKYR